MARMKERFNNAWVDSDKVGKVRYLGADVAYGPPSGEVNYESVIWPQEPVDTDNLDGDQTYNMGINFGVTQNVNVLGVRWRVPDVLTSDPSGGQYVVSVWDNPTETRLAFKAFTPIPGDYQNIFFDTPLPVVVGGDYVCAVYTRHYVYRSATSAAPSPSGILVVQYGRLVPYNGGSNIYPEGNYDSWYYVAPIIQI